MISFKNDYSEGAHPQILKALLESNMLQAEGYGEDFYTMEACRRIKHRLNSEVPEIHLISGGTQTNLIAISGFLRPHEAVVSASTGHVLVHETGAIEATGHKVIAVDTKDGKLEPRHLESVLKAHTDEHMVKPRLVYISNSTEIGTFYTKCELASLSAYCKAENLLLYMDGARLGSALCAEGNDLTLEEIGQMTDAFYIGATKAGGLLGEALVICNKALQQDMRYLIKQKGALLAKGRLLGIQFMELFQDDLYFQLSAHANQMAALLSDGFRKAGFGFLTASTTNQIFPVLPNAIIEKLQEKYGFYIWAPVGEDTAAIRLVTSWATEKTVVEGFIATLNQCCAHKER